MSGVSHSESAVMLRYGTVDNGTFVTGALRILDSRVGRYRGDGLRGALILAAELELACSERLAVLRLRTGTESEAAVGTAEDTVALSLDVTVEPDPRSGFRLVGLGPEPLPLCRGSVDAVRCANLVFGFGDVEGEGPAAEFGLTVRVDAGLQCAYAYGTPQDPYSPRWEVSVRPVAVAVMDRERGRALPEPAAIGQIAARCLAG